MGSSNFLLTPTEGRSVWHLVQLKGGSVWQSPPPGLQPTSEVKWYWANYAGRPTLLYKATKQTEDIRKTCAPGMGAQIWYKREGRAVPYRSHEPPPPSLAPLVPQVPVLCHSFFTAEGARGNWI